MKTKLYLKIFAATGIPFGLIMGMILAGLGAVASLSQDLRMQTPHLVLIGLFLGVFSGVLFGIAMSAILGTLHFAKTDNPNVRHQCHFVVNASMAEAQRMCQEAIRSIPSAVVSVPSSGEAKIVAKTGMTWRSFGEVITCSIHSDDQGRQVVSVESRPWLKTTIVDYGRNLENIKKITVQLQCQGATILE